MARIAALLPEQRHGVCAGDSNIPLYQAENGYFPKDAMLSPYFVPEE